MAGRIERYGAMALDSMLSHYGLLGRYTSQKLGLPGKAYGSPMTGKARLDTQNDTTTQTVSYIAQNWSNQRDFLANNIPQISKTIGNLEKTINDTADLLSRSIGDVTLAMANQKKGKGGSNDDNIMFVSGQGDPQKKGGSGFSFPIIPWWRRKWIGKGKAEEKLKPTEEVKSGEIKPEVKPTEGVTSKLLRGGGKVLRGVSKVLGPAAGLYEGAQEYSETGNTGRAVGAGLGTWGGIEAGAWAGGTIGATVGSVVPLVGTGIGGLVGGIGGGILGGMYGGKLGADLLGGKKEAEGKNRIETQPVNHMKFDVERKIIFKAREITFKAPYVQTGMSGTGGGKGSVKAKGYPKPTPPKDVKTGLWDTTKGILRNLLVPGAPLSQYGGGQRPGIGSSTFGGGALGAYGSDLPSVGQSTLTPGGAVGGPGIARSTMVPGGALKQGKNEYGKGGDAAEGHNFGGVPSEIIANARKAALEGGAGGVQRFMAEQGYPQRGSWCGEFAASVIKASGGSPPKNPAIASNWRNWGSPDAEPHEGDVAVRRGVPTGSTGSHVTFVEKIDPTTGRFTGLGGNQGRPESSFRTSDYEFRKPNTQETAFTPATPNNPGPQGTPVTPQIQSNKPGPQDTTQSGGITGKTSIAQLERDPATQAAIQRFQQSFPGITNAKQQLYSLVAGESGFGRDMVQKNQYAGYFQLGKNEAYGQMGLTKQQFAALPFSQQLDAYTKWAAQNDPKGETLKNLGLFNAASAMKWQKMPDNTVVYPAGSKEALANLSTWGRYSNAGGATTVGGIKQYYARNDPQTLQQLANAEKFPNQPTQVASTDSTKSTNSWLQSLNPVRPAMAEPAPGAADKFPFSEPTPKEDNRVWPDETMIPPIPKPPTPQAPQQQSSPPPLSPPITPAAPPPQQQSKTSDPPSGPSFSDMTSMAGYYP